MGATLTAVRRLGRRFDHAAERYEAAVDEDWERQKMDWMVSGLLCLWTLIQVGVLTHYLQIYPLF